MGLDLKLNKDETKILNDITDVKLLENEACSLRLNGCPLLLRETPFIKIKYNEETKGYDFYVKENSKKQVLSLPVIVGEGGITDKVHNNFYIGANAQVVIMAGCGIHNCHKNKAEHNGVHHFYIESGADVKYIEVHSAKGDKISEKILNPQTYINLGSSACLEMDTIQKAGVSSSIRKTYAKVMDGAKLIIKEKIVTKDNQEAKSLFEVDMEGVNSSCHLISRAYATDSSVQDFASCIKGNNKCYAHSECDAIINGGARVVAKPIVEANNENAKLVHEATIGKISKEQLLKLMTLGLSEKEAEKVIIDGFLK